MTNIILKQQVYGKHVLWPLYQVSSIGNCHYYGYLMYTLIWKISENLLLQNVKSISKGFKKANVNIQCRFANGWTLICSIMMVMSAQRVPGIPCMFLAP